MAKQKISIQQIAMNFVNNQNENTFTELVNRLKPGLTSFAYKFLEDKETSNDMVSKTFIAIWEKVEQYNSKYNFSTWAYAITKNECLHYIKEKKKTVSHEMLTENHSKLLKACSPVETMNIEIVNRGEKEDIFTELYNKTINVIHALKEPYKTVMIEREINNKKLHDIAVDLDWNLSTVKTRLRKAKVDVANTIKKDNKELISEYYDEIY